MIVLPSDQYKILANLSWLFFDKVLKILLGIIIMTSVAKYLGASQYGTLNYCITYAAMLSPLATLGLDTLAVRDLVLEESSKNKVFATTFWMRLVGASIYVVLTIASTCVFNQETIVVQMVSVIAFSTIFRPFDVIDFWFQSQVNSKYTVISKTISYLIASFLKIFLVYHSASLIAFAWVIVAESLLSSLALLASYIFKYRSINLLEWSWKVGKKMLKESWPLIFSGFAIFLYMKIDQLMLGSMINNRSVGIYSVAANLSEVWMFLPTIIIESSSFIAS
jgi:polysaccharide transporter, PST family